jgi:hypothetical protein
MTRKTLRRLARALTLAARALEAEAKATPLQRSQPAKRRTMTLTPKRRAQLKLHGRYIGTIRMLPAAQKERVRRERATRGTAAAIRLARRLGSAA